MTFVSNTNVNGSVVIFQIEKISPYDVSAYMEFLPSLEKPPSWLLIKLLERRCVQAFDFSKTVKNEKKKIKHVV